MRRPIPRLIAVGSVCLASAAVWLLVPGHQSTAVAFNKFAESFVTAKTARYQIESHSDGKLEYRGNVYFLAPAKSRMEILNRATVPAKIAEIYVIDRETGKFLTIHRGSKTAFLENVKAGEEAGIPTFFFQRLRELSSMARDSKVDQFERVAEKTIGGKPAIGFRYNYPGHTLTLWGDAATGQPLQVEYDWSGPLHPHSQRLTLTNFEINVDLKQSLFDLTPPPGYKVQSLDRNVSTTSEFELIEAFKSYSELSEGEFPDTMNAAGIARLNTVDAKIRGKKSSDDDVKGLKKQMDRIGGGFGFALKLPESADAHYAGKGVRRDAKDTPIFWYKPFFARTYRVLYADLSIHDADSAPQVAGAQRIEKATKNSKSSAK